MYICVSVYIFIYMYSKHLFTVVVQSLSHVWLCDLMNCSTPGVSFTVSWSLLSFMYIESVMPSNHLISPFISIVCVLSHFSHAQLFVTLWTVACQSPLPVGFYKNTGVGSNWYRGSSQPKDQTCISCIVGGFFTHWATWQALLSVSIYLSSLNWPLYHFVVTLIVSHYRFWVKAYFVGYG